MGRPGKRILFNNQHGGPEEIMRLKKEYLGSIEDRVRDNRENKLKIENVEKDDEIKLSK